MRKGEELLKTRFIDIKMTDELPREQPGDLARKVLDENCVLVMHSWTSDMVSPGRRMYALKLFDKDAGYFTSGFPSNYEDYTEAKIRDLYDEIKTKADFYRKMAEEKSRR